MEGATFYDRLNLALLTPVFIAALTAASFFAGHALHRSGRALIQVARRLSGSAEADGGGESQAAQRERFFNGCQANALFLLFLLYPSLSATILATFACREVRHPPVLTSAC